MEHNNDADDEIGTTEAGCLLLYCSCLLIAVWIAAELNVSFWTPIFIFTPPVLCYGLWAMWTVYKSRSTMLLPIHEPASPYGTTLSRQSSSDSAHTVLDHSNSDSCRTLYLLRATERALKEDLEDIGAKADVIYKVHQGASAFIYGRNSDRRGERCNAWEGWYAASSEWYAVSKRMQNKKKELQRIQQEIVELREEANTFLYCSC
ncbi:unnamed protein product [Diplocarpon coronariae]